MAKLFCNGKKKDDGFNKTSRNRTYVMILGKMTILIIVERFVSCNAALSLFFKIRKIILNENAARLETKVGMTKFIKTFCEISLPKPKRGPLSIKAKKATLERIERGFFE